MCPLPAMNRDLPNERLTAPLAWTRRDMLSRCGLGLGSLALADLLGATGPEAWAQDGPAGMDPMIPRAPHFPGRAKHLIHIFLNGGCSHLDTFDPKPSLQRLAGQNLPVENLRTERKTGAAFPSPFQFSRHGESGLEISELFAHTARSADELLVIRSMHANVPNHEPSLMLWNCGDQTQVRPSMGSWVTYGLGTENQNLPGFIVMCPGGYPIKDAENWQAAFLPGAYQGTYVDTKHRDVEKLIANVRNPKLSLSQQRRQLDFIQAMNRAHSDRRQHEAPLESRIHSLELAYRMQIAATDAFDVQQEPRHIQEMYGPGTQAQQILMARRLVERGVRYVQVWHGAGQPWDNHDDIEANHRRLAGECDRAIGALLVDLKQRGLLDETIVMIGGEFGRTPTVELPQPGANAGKINGRDHNHWGFTTVLAGGGLKRGHVHGATDEFGFAAVENKVHVHDLQATLLHLLGFDHTRLTYRFAGRDFRLTDVHGSVIPELLA